MNHRCIKKSFALVLFFSIIFSTTAIADGGMWLPMLLKDQKYQKMKENGLKLSAEDIYSINQSSLKDAIVQFGGGCTGELISNEGLLITNHHCGYGQIQKHSTIEHDYLTNGFWAMNRTEELPNPGLTVSFLVQMSDVSPHLLKGVSSEMSENERLSLIEQNKVILKKAVNDTCKYELEFEPFYQGNQYFMFVYEVFKDIRLVGAPPSSIGKFGGDTDNWMWPRHTGDFSLFRIYADKNNKPVDYAVDNVPYVPKKSLKIDIRGVKENDFTMVYGYPGHTEEYLFSDAVRFIVEKRDPTRIKLRDTKLAIMREQMLKSDKVRIQLSSKYAGVANGWKKWMGEIRGLERMNAVAVKTNFESNFEKWLAQDENRQKEYADLFPKFKTTYQNASEHALAREYIFESVFGVEAITFAARVYKTAQNKDLTPEKLNQMLSSMSQGFFKDFDATTDQMVMEALFKIYYQDMIEVYQPDFFRTVEKKYSANFEKYAQDVFAKSIITNEERFNMWLKKADLKKLEADPIVQIYLSAISFYTTELAPVLYLHDNELSVLNRKYMKAQLEFAGDSVLFPDANFTLRVAFGKVGGYEPKDGVVYKHQTTLEGILEKEFIGAYDYEVDPKLKKLQSDKDFGIYGQDQTMPVCFSASNHTTGGNSGSPVMNAEGHLIGVNFDRNWEGTMSDVMYDPTQCRNIVLDIRYALFIIDKFAGAGYLLNEMDIVKN